MTSKMYFVFVVAAFAFSSATALERLPKEYEQFKINVFKIVYQCGEQYNVDGPTIQKAIDDSALETLDPCFLGCVFEKTGLINSNGQVTADVAIERLRPYVASPRKMHNISHALKQCGANVNAQSPKDTCEAGHLLTPCLQAAYIRLSGKADQ